MGLANCPDCGKLFLKTSVNVCPECWGKEQDDAEKVMEYLRDAVHKATLEQIHEATGVKHKIILRLLRSGRIMSDVDISYPCESCGAPILEGRLCDKCSQNFAEQIAHMSQRDKAKHEQEEQARQGGRMYSRDDEFK